MLDIIICKTNDEQNMLYINNGDGTFTPYPRFGTGYSQGIACGDYDNDADLDVIVTNDIGEPNLLYENVDGINFNLVDTLGTGSSRSVAWADIDNDGDFDIILVNRSYEQNWFFENRLIPDGTPSFVQHDQFGLGYSEGAAWADYDNDGDLDLGVANWSSGPSKLYRNNQNDQDYIKARLIGGGACGYSNKDGIGAKVAVSDYPSGNLRAYGEVNAGSGFCSQNALMAHFGVPSGGQYNIRVDWPSGRVTTYENYEAPLVLTIYEFKCGNADGDTLENINLSDVITLANYYFGKPCCIVPQASDVNCKDGINLSDVVLIANYYFGKVPELNCCP